MPKTKKTNTDVDVGLCDKVREESFRKKSKHKHKKHRKKKERSPSTCSEEIDVVGLDMKQEEAKPLKLKIKLGGQTFGSAKVVSLPRPEKHKLPEIDEETIIATDDETKTVEFEEQEEEEFLDIDEESEINNEELNEIKQKPKGKKSDDDEEKWLNALDEGTLDDYGCVKKTKKVSAMTARQRSLYGHSVCGENELMELPLFTKKPDEDTEEVERRRKQRAKKRRQQMQQQIEDNKAQTINKLLSKQPAKLKKDERSSKKKLPPGWKHVRYTNNASGISLSTAEGVDMPIIQHKPISFPDSQLLFEDDLKADSAEITTAKSNSRLRDSLGKRPTPRQPRTDGEGPSGQHSSSQKRGSSSYLRPRHSSNHDRSNSYQSRRKFHQKQKS